MLSSLLGDSHPPVFLCRVCYRLLEPFNVSLRRYRFQTVAKSPYGSFKRDPGGFSVRPRFAHECFILVYITVAQLFGNTLSVVCVIIKHCLFHSALSFSHFLLLYVICPFKSHVRHVTITLLLLFPISAVVCNA